MSLRTLALLLVILATFGLAACGDDDSAGAGSGNSGSEATERGDDSPTDAGDDGGGDAGEDEAAADGQTLELGVEGNELKFDTTELEADAGTVTLRLNNTSAIPHNIAVEDEGGNTVGEPGELVGDGEASETTVELEPGTYTYYCEPHRSSGMTGTLTVS